MEERYHVQLDFEEIGVGGVMGSHIDLALHLSPVGALVTFWSGAMRCCPYAVDIAEVGGAMGEGSLAFLPDPGGKRQKGENGSARQCTIASALSQRWALDGGVRDKSSLEASLPPPSASGKVGVAADEAWRLS